MSPFLSLAGVTKTYDGKTALQDLSLDVPDGEILAILGPSGSGKSTLLRLVAGLEPPDHGQILLEGRDQADVPPHRRGLGLMFQDYALFPHMTVSGNVGFGLRKGWTRSQRAARIQELLRLVHLEGFERRDVLSLSGGEQQRVALARALAPSPRLLMLDEPLGALDATLRSGLLDELGSILGAVGLAVLYVTHDHAEALGIARRVALLQGGRLVQVARPAELVSSPANGFVASFLRLGAIVPARVLSAANGTASVRTDFGELTAPWTTSASGHPDHSSLLIRPTAVSFCARAGARKVAVHLVSTVPHPGGTLVRIALDGTSAAAEVECLVPPRTRNDEPSVYRALTGDLRSVWIDPAGCLALPTG